MEERTHHRVVDMEHARLGIVCVYALAREGVTHRIVVVARLVKSDGQDAMAAPGFDVLVRVTAVAVVGLCSAQGLFRFV